MYSYLKFMTVILMLFSFSVATAHDTPESLIKQVTVVPQSKIETDQYIVSYLHMNRRCATCEKLEEFTTEAVTTGFVELLKDSSLVWTVVNFEEEGNEHLAETYKLYTQSVVISKMRDGKEIEWKALNQIWVLVGDRDEFISYVQAEIKEFMTQIDRK